MLVDRIDETRRRADRDWILGKFVASFSRRTFVRNMISQLDYFRLDLLGALFVVQFLILAVKGKAVFPVGSAQPRFSMTQAKSMRARYFWAIAAGALFAGVLWDLYRKLLR
jgi:hypothetical protein